MVKRSITSLLIFGCIFSLMIGFSSCSGGSRGRSTAHIKKSSGFSPGKGKTKSPAKRIKSSKK